MSYLVKYIFSSSWVIIIPKKIQETKHTTVTLSPLNRHQKVVIFHKYTHHVKSIHTHHSCGNQNLNPDVFGDLKSQIHPKSLNQNWNPHFFGESDLNSTLKSPFFHPKIPKCHHPTAAKRRTAQSPPPVTTKCGDARTQVTPCLRFQHRKRVQYVFKHVLNDEPLE